MTFLAAVLSTVMGSGGVLVCNVDHADGSQHELLVIGDRDGESVSVDDNNVMLHKHCGHPPAPCISGGNTLCGTTLGASIPGPRQFFGKETCCHCGATQVCWSVYRQKGGSVPAGHGEFFPVAVQHYVSTGKVECDPWVVKEKDHSQ